MTRCSAVITFALLASPGLGSPIADVICDATPRLEQRLERTLMAERTASGMRSVEQVMEVWTDRKGDWILVSRYATGQSCIVAMGQHWQQDGPAS